jgi:hypothetical protein
MIAVTAVSVLINVILLVLWFYARQARHWSRGMNDITDGKTVRPQFRRFIARRHVDVTGISGTGTPVEGVVFSDGWGVTHWLDRPPMNEPKTEIWHKPFNRPGPDPFTKISGHGGSTEVVWIDAS